MSKLDDQIAKQAAHIAQQDPGQISTSAAEKYIDPNIRAMLTERLDNARQVIAVTEALLNELPESILRAPVSMFRRLF